VWSYSHRRENYEFSSKDAKKGSQIRFSVDIYNKNFRFLKLNLSDERKINHFPLAKKIIWIESSVIRVENFNEKNQSLKFISVYYMDYFIKNKIGQRLLIAQRLGYLKEKAENLGEYSAKNKTREKRFLWF